MPIQLYLPRHCEFFFSSKEISSKAVSLDKQQYFINFLIDQNGDKFIKMSEYNRSTRKRTNLFFSYTELPNVISAMDTVKQGDRHCVDLESDMFNDVNMKVKYKSTTNQVEIGWTDEKANFFKKLIIRDSVYDAIKGHFQNALDSENSKKGPFDEK